MTFTSTKVDAIVQSNGWDDATAALQLLSHLFSSSGAGVQASVASGISGCTDCTLRIAQAVGRLSSPI